MLLTRSGKRWINELVHHATTIAIRVENAHQRRNEQLGLRRCCGLDDHFLLLGCGDLFLVGPVLLMPKKLILTDRQAQALDAIVELGQTDLVARKLGLSTKTIETYVRRAMITNKYPNRLTLAIARDRENRAAQDVQKSKTA